jgi:peroxiredoxin
LQTFQFFFQEKAIAWKKDTKCEFPMLLDADRRLYVALGLKRSVSKVWAISSLVYYAEQKLAGRILLSMLDEDDPHQLGGDFIIDSTGKLVLVYQSKTSTDRPSVHFVLNFLQSNSDPA